MIMSNEETDWLIACPTCLAKIGEPCHSMTSGCIPDAPHAMRIPLQQCAMRPRTPGVRWRCRCGQNINKRGKNAST